MSLEIQCRHKNCDLHGICEDCGAKARIFIEGVPANQRSVVDMRPVSGETPHQEKIRSLEAEIRRLRDELKRVKEFCGEYFKDDGDSDEEAYEFVLRRVTAHRLANAEVERLRDGIVAIGSIMLEGRDIHEMYYYKKLESLLNPPTGCPVPGCTQTDTHIHDSIGEAV